MTIGAVLFDIDGTLVDSKDMHVLAWQEAFTGVGMNFDRATIHSQIGKGADMLVPSLIRNADEATQNALGEAHGVVFKDKFLHQVEAFPRARDLLERVHSTGEKWSSPPRLRDRSWTTTWIC